MKINASLSRAAQVGSFVIGAGFVGYGFVGEFNSTAAPIALIGSGLAMVVGGLIGT